MRWTETFSQPIDSRQLRNFILLMTGFSVLIASRHFFLSNPNWSVAASVAIAIPAIYWIYPNLFAFPFRLWMFFGHVVGIAMQYVWLTLIYFGWITPMAVFRKARAFFRREESPVTYLVAKSPRDRTHFERMF